MSIATRFPAYVCWRDGLGYFAQVGTGDNAEWFDRDGDPIPHDQLHVEWDPLPRFRTVDELGLVDTVADALAVITKRYALTTYDCIHLAHTEYGNELMACLAGEWFDAHPRCEFVLMYEHAGWFLGFRRDGSIWATANDRASLQKRWPKPVSGIGQVVRRTPRAVVGSTP